VLNQRFGARYVGDDNPIGNQLEVKDFASLENGLQRSFRMKSEQGASDATFQIVGVVGDVKNAGPQQPAVPMAFIRQKNPQKNRITGDFIVQVRRR